MVKIYMKKKNYEYSEKLKTMYDFGENKAKYSQKTYEYNENKNNLSKTCTNMVKTQHFIYSKKINNA